jgi:serine protease
MNKLKARFLIALFLNLLAIVSFHSNYVNSQSFVPGQIIIDIRHEYLPLNATVDSLGNVYTGLLSLDSLNNRFHCLSFMKISNFNWEPIKGMYVLTFPDTLDVFQLVSIYLHNSHIHLADPCYIRTPYGHIPIDSLYPEQWGHDVNHMNTAGAWRYTSGIHNIVTEVIDWGTDWDHPDIAKNVWQNLGEDADGDGHTMEWNATAKKWVFDPGDSNYYDDDADGFVDDFVGWDFYNFNNPPGYSGDNNPRVEMLSGEHGDHTAGTIGAVTNNVLTADEATNVCVYRRGTVAGTSWFSRIMITRFGGSDQEAIQAIEYGVAKGANIISMSWGSIDTSTDLEQTLLGAYNEGVLLIASSGNYIYDVPTYPASYPFVLAVSATNINDVKESYSNYGTWVDICAPGDNYSPGREPKWGRYCYSVMGGTSIAAPFVAGVAAMVWSCNPSATNVQIKNAILSTADNIYSIPENYPYIGKLGSGRVNALNAVKVFRPVAPPPGDCNSNIVVEAGDIVYLISYLYQYGSPPDPFCVGNVNGDGVIGVGDVTYLISYLYRGGPPPIDGCY